MLRRREMEMTDNERVAQGLENCDWSGVPIGNKAIIQYAVDLLRATPADQEPKRAIFVSEEDLRLYESGLYSVFMVGVETPNRVIPIAPHSATPADHSNIEQYVLSVLPSVYYMDPPDGGDVSILEQLRRMADDAAKYRATVKAPQNAADHIEAQCVPTYQDPVAFVTVKMHCDEFAESDDDATLSYSWSRASGVNIPVGQHKLYLAHPVHPEAQSVRDAERYRYLTSRVVMTDASTPGITVITFVDDAIDEPNRFLDEIVDAGLKSAPPQKPVMR